MKPELKFLEKKAGEWFDIETHQNEKGTISAFELKDKTSGKWILNVRESESGKIVVTAEVGTETTSLHEQIKRKSMVLKPYGSDKTYQMLGISKNNSGRVSMNRIENINDLDQEIRDNFQIDKYNSVNPNSKLGSKYIAILDRSDHEKMVYLFYLQKIKPIF